MVLKGGFSESHAYGEPEVNKAREFIACLLSDPELKTGSPIWCERIITKYLENNISGLRKKLHEPGFYPFMDTEQALELVYRSLYGMVSEKVLPVINRFIEESDFSFLDRTYGSGAISDEFRKARLYNFIKMVFEHRAARYNMNGFYNILFYDVVERYSAEIFKRKDFLYQKLVTEQKTAADLKEFIVFLKLLLLIKNAVYIRNHIDPSKSDSEVKITQVSGSMEKLRKHIEYLAGYISTFLSGIPDTVIELAVESNFPGNKTCKRENIPGFLFILNSRFQNQNMLIPDRGAESPDKSWFRLAEKNSTYFGYNADIVRELEIISGENNW